jgi:hypothetical protein
LRFRIYFFIYEIGGVTFYSILSSVWIEQQFSKLKVTGSNPVGCNMLAILVFITFCPAIGKMSVYFSKNIVINNVLWEKLNKLLKLTELGERIMRICELMPILVGVGVVVWVFAIAYAIFLLQPHIILMVFTKFIWLDPHGSPIFMFMYTLSIPVGIALIRISCIINKILAATFHYLIPIQYHNNYNNFCNKKTQRQFIESANNSYS